MILSTLLGGRDERKGEKHPPSALMGGKVKTIHPLRRFAPRPACLRGTIGWRSDILL